MRRFILGDIHGEYEYLLDILKKSNFDYDNDLLIQIGDIVDRGPEPFKCIDEILKIKNLILISGNHDACFTAWVYSGRHPLGLSMSGAQNGTLVTVEKWKNLSKDQHLYYLNNFFNQQESYHITDDNIMFVHGGFDRFIKLEDQDDFIFQWDRELIEQAMSCKGDQKLKTLYNFKEIFIGHTPTLYYNRLDPIYSGGVWNIDTGSGKGGPLTIMDIDTHEYWQSDHKFKDYVIIEKGKEATGESQEENSSEELREAA